MKTCGRCEHLDGSPIPTNLPRVVHYCRKLMTWQVSTTPRGEPRSPFHCGDWAEAAERP